MAGFSALGTKLIMSTDSITLGSSSGLESEILGDLTNISGPTMSAEEIDVSSHDSTGYFREFVAGFLDGGEVSLEGNLTVGGGADDLVDAFADRVSRNFAVVFPATGTSAASTYTYLGHWLRWTFAGTVTGVETAAPYDDKAGFSASIRVSGQPVLSATTTT